MKKLAVHQLGLVVSVGKSNVVPLADCYWTVADFVKSKLSKEELNL